MASSETFNFDPSPAESSKINNAILWRSWPKEAGQHETVRKISLHQHNMGTDNKNNVKILCVI